MQLAFSLVIDVQCSGGFPNLLDDTEIIENSQWESIPRQWPELNGGHPRIDLVVRRTWDGGLVVPGCETAELFLQQVLFPATAMISHTKIQPTR